MRARLWALHHGVPTPALTNAALVSLPAHQPDWPAGFAAMAGWVEAGPILLRLDIAEKIAGELGFRSRRGSTALPSGLASRFAIKPDMVPAVLRPLGFRVLPAAGLEPEQHGPPAPPMLLPLRRRRPLVDQPAVVAAVSGPFAALAVLRQGGAR
jgi:ATP-dependent RNA helicase SUPV3L1/SUV3